MLKPHQPDQNGRPSTGVAAPQRARARWTGILQLRLLAVPVTAYPAVSTTDTIRFNQLHAPCKQRIRYEKHCPIHGKVEAAEILVKPEYRGRYGAQLHALWAVAGRVQLHPLVFLHRVGRVFRPGRKADGS